MKKKMFEELVASVREAGAILRGQKKPSRRTAIGASGRRFVKDDSAELPTRAIRLRLGR